MKKLLLAVAVSTVAAGSVNAATVYEKGGLTYKLNGDFQVQFRQKTGDDERAGIDFDDLELKNYISYDLGNDLTAFGRLDFDFKDDANGKDVDEPIDEAFVGLKYGVTSFSIGKQNFASEEFGIEQAIEIATIDEDRFDGIATDGEDTVRIDIELDNVYIAASHNMNANSGDGEFYDLFVATELVGLELAAAYQQYKPANFNDSVGTWGVSAAYDFGVVKLAADYSMSDWDTELLVEEDMTQYNVAAVFPVASTTDVAIGMGNKDSDAANYEDITEWYANVTYKFPAATNVSVFAEIAQSDQEYADGDDADLGFLAGMRLKF